MSTMPVDFIPDKMIEEALESVGESLDKKLGGKWWVKPLYYASIGIVLSIPIIYFFW